MSASRPRRLAAALLERFDPADQALVGDLLEECQRGRSGWWCWRQVLAVIVRSARRDKTRTAWGLAIAVVVHYLLGFPTAEFLNLLNLWLTPRVPGWFLDYDLHRLWAIAFMFLVFHLLGIIITAIQPPRHRLAVLLAFVVYLAVWDFQEGPLWASRGAYTFLWFTVWQVPTCAAHVAGLLLGGVAFWNPQRSVA